MTGVSTINMSAPQQGADSRREGRMPTLTELLDPATFAVVTIEMQRGVIGDIVAAWTQ
jgi:hypothetical protein